MSIRQTSPYAEQDARMSQAYKHIAKQLATFSKRMLDNMSIIQNAGGIIDDEEISDTLNDLAKMINSCLYNISDLRVSVTKNLTDEVKSNEEALKKIITKNIVEGTYTTITNLEEIISSLKCLHDSLICPNNEFCVSANDENK